MSEQTAQGRIDAARRMLPPPIRQVFDSAVVYGSALGRQRVGQARPDEVERATAALADQLEGVIAALWSGGGR